MPANESKHPTFAAEAIPSDVRSGQFLGNAALDNLMSCVVAMGAELWATKRRLKVVEAVLKSSGISRDAIERYVPSEQERAEWERDRDRFIELTLGPLANDSYRGASMDFPKR